MRRKPMRWRRGRGERETWFELGDDAVWAMVYRSAASHFWKWTVRGYSSEELYSRYKDAQAAAVAYIKQQEAVND